MASSLHDHQQDPTITTTSDEDITVEMIEAAATLSESSKVVEETPAATKEEETRGESTSPDNAAASFVFDAKQKKKLDKILDSVLKLKTVPNGAEAVSAQDKLYSMTQKFVDLQEQCKRLQMRDKEVEKATSLIVKQRDLAQSEVSKYVLIKSKLESLCRELQKQNKQIKEENLQRIKEEEDKRKEITTKFQTAIDEINQQVSSNAEKNQTLISENSQLTSKLKTLLEQYEIKEQHTDKVLKHKDLEIQLANAKLQQAELKCTELAERHKQEKAIYESHISELVKKCDFHKEAETQLRSQLTMYTQKYEEFQSTLNKSNDVFASFRTEMDKMTKKMKKLEQENAAWRSKFESCNKSLATMLEVKENMDKELKKSHAKADAMEQLSRTLQAERNALKQQLKQQTTNEKATSDDADSTTTTAAATTESASEEEKKHSELVAEN